MSSARWNWNALRGAARQKSFCLGGGLLLWSACGSTPATSLELDEAGVVLADGGVDAGWLPGTDAGLVGVVDAAAPGKDGGLPPVHIDSCGADNAAGLSQAQLGLLAQGGPAGTMRFLYPFDGTVFPRGLKAPLLMWEDGKAVAVRVHISSSWFEYTGCLRADGIGRIQLPAEVWHAAEERSLGKTDPFNIEVTELSASGVVRGPLRESIIIAPGSLKGTVYYNSYSSPLALKAGAPGGAILRIRPGAEAEVFAGQRSCVGCHSVSANGSRLVASNLNDGSTEGVYTLTPQGAVNPPSTRGGAEFVGLSPDGSVYVFSGMLYETDTGTVVENAMIPAGAQHPSFSPDGRWLTFVEPTAITDDVQTSDYELVRMRYDATARRASDRQAVARTSGNGLSFLDWPSFLPDNGALLVAETYQQGRLLLLDLTSGSQVPLTRAMAPSSGQTAPRPDGTLPGAFYPTVVPVAAGGYFWIFFDSSSPYGNVDTSAKAPNDPGGLPPDPGFLGGLFAGLFGGGAGGSVGAPVPVPEPTVGAPSRQLWGAAIEISPDGQYKSDPSSPPFYLPGQELGTNNHRAFAALEPCTKQGNSCKSGVDCCDGFCRDGTCSAPPSTCSRTEEACKSAEDCCETGDLCISGFCSVLPLTLQ